MKSNKYLSAIQKISELVSKNVDFTELMKNILIILSNEVNMQRGMISIYRRDLQKIIVDVTYGIPKQGEMVFYKVGEGITGKVVETGRPIAIPRIDKEPLFLDRTGARRKIDRSKLAFICVPIKYDNEVVGALSVDRVSEKDDLKFEVSFLETIANIIASKVHSRRIMDENIKLRDAISRHSPVGTIIGNSSSMRHVAELINQVAETDTTILITGETGTGKGLVASEIHQRSRRKNGPFIRVNCGAIPENLIESELFGHEKGSFTGAISTRKGKFEEANRGTIFLDEIGELSLSAQVKLLKVLEDREVTRIGSNKPIKVDVRIIAATNKNLEKEVEKGNFRLDLLYRLNIFPIHLPPLRERGSDIILLADYFVQVLSEKLGKKIKRIDSSAIDLMMSYHWPGNVRELQNCIERAILIAEGDVIYGYHLPPSLQIEGELKQEKTLFTGNFKELVENYEKTLIVNALKKAKGKQSEAAKILGTTKRIIQYKIQKYEIDYKKYAGVTI